jgi:hypothetical protein
VPHARTIKNSGTKKKTTKITPPMRTRASTLRDRTRGYGSRSGLDVFLRPFRARPNLDDRFQSSRNHLLAHPATRFGRVDTGETATCALTVKRGGVSVMPVTRKKETSSKIDKEANDWGDSDDQAVAR